MANNKLAKTAVAGLTAESGFEKISGYCMRYVRQCIQKTHGHKYDKYFRPSAVESMEAFRNSPYAVKVDPNQPGGGSVAGDILFKGTRTSGKYGHVGIRVPGNKVAENSSSHINEAGDRDARGTRSLEAYGKFELIVRLPE